MLVNQLREQEKCSCPCLYAMLAFVCQERSQALSFCIIFLAIITALCISPFESVCKFPYAIHGIFEGLNSCLSTCRFMLHIDPYIVICKFKAGMSWG